jgi:hypothetical protein
MYVEADDGGLVRRGRDSRPAWRARRSESRVSLRVISASNGRIVVKEGSALPGPPFSRCQGEGVLDQCGVVGSQLLRVFSR